MFQDRVTVWVFDNDTKKSFLICSIMEDNEKLFDFLMDCKLSITSCQDEEWEYYLDHPTHNITSYLVENNEDVLTVIQVIMASRDLG